MGLTIGVDIGGTFTDFVIWDAERQTYFTHKVLTTSRYPDEAVVAGMREILGRLQRPAGDVTLVAHATTLATNAIIERRGARVGFLTTEGFRDVVMIGNEHRYDMQDLLIDLPQPLVRRRDVAEIQERIGANGEVIRPLEVVAVRRGVERLLREGVETIAIGFLHSYRNPAHEELAAEVIRGEMGVAYVSVSHEIAPVIREFGRFSTTIANAYIQPLVARYIGALGHSLANMGVGAPLLIMASNGGLMHVEDARNLPVRLIESGPAAGVMAAAKLATALSLPRVLSFDMGGTTAKGSIVEGGRPTGRFELEVARLERFKPGSGLPLVVPTVDLIEVGAGGGSIAWVDGVGRLRVGPESAGADPGPACYGRGGQSPTVTDADLLLGLLNPDQFAGKSFRLDPGAAMAAIERVASGLNASVMDVAWGIHATVNENMASAFRIHAIERGVDVRNCPIIAFGGAGPVHTCAIAELLGVREIYVPSAASVYSAIGLIATPPSFAAVRTFQARLEDLDSELILRIFRDLEGDCLEKVRRAAFGVTALSMRRSLDMRYAGQVREIEVELPEMLTSREFISVIRAAFQDEYRRRFSREIENVPLEVVNFRAAVYAQTEAPITSKGNGPRGARPSTVVGVRRVYFAATAPIETSVYQWANLPPGYRFEGPALVDRPDTVAVVRPGWVAEVLNDGTLHLRHQA